MKKYLCIIAVLAFVITIALIIIQSCSSSASAPVAYVKTPGNTAEIVIDEGENTNIKSSLLVYPTEIYWGDTVYVQRVDENLSSETIKTEDLNGFFWRFSIEGSASAGGYSGGYSYEWVTEYPGHYYQDMPVLDRNLQPAEKYFQCTNNFEFPPLEDLKNPFWEETRNNMSSPSLKKQFNLSTRLNSKLTKTTVEILVKPRPEPEMELLDAWYQNTPEKTFPEVDGNRKNPHETDLRASKKSWILIGRGRYDPWLFVRLGNRKPCDPNNPTTLNGWRKLEASLTPSTMRDEVRLVRLQLEYYCAEPGVKSDLAKQELDQWLKSLPTPQQAVYMSFLKDKQNSFKYDAPALAKKNMELIIYLSR